VLFGDKEPHMVPLNDVITSNRAVLRGFVDKVSTRATEQDNGANATQGGSTLAAFAFMSKVVSSKTIAESEAGFFKPLSVPRPTAEVSLVIVYNQLHRNKEAVLAALAKYGSSDEVKIIKNKTTAIMDALGEPLTRSTITGEKRQERE
jgi:hypothetical protein